MSEVIRKTVAVFGATGNQGGAVVDALLDRGAHVRALVRSTDSDRAQVLVGRGVELAYADVDHPESLPEALGDVDAFFFMTTPPGGVQTEDTAGETRQGIALADAAAAAQVPHVVFNSVGGAERNSGVPHFESKRRVEEHIRELGLPAVFIRPAFFIDNLAGMGPSVEDGEIVLRLPLPDGVPLQMIAVRDIGVVAAQALLGTAGIDGSLEIAGDERTGSEMAAAFAEYTGKPARYEALPLDVLAGHPDMQQMFRWFAETPAYQADITKTHAMDPDAWNVADWLAATGWAAPEGSSDS